VIDRPVPSAPESERIVLGSMLLNPEIIPLISNLVEPSDFFESNYVAIYSAILRLVNQARPVDCGMIAQELKSVGKLDTIGGMTALAALMDNVLTVSNAEEHASIIKDYAVKRGLIASAAKIHASAYDESKTGEEIVGEAANQLVELSTSSARADALKPVSLVVSQGLKVLEERSVGNRYITGLSTGMEWLDLKTSGLQRGEFWMLAARPSRGKSIFCEQLCYHVASKGHPSLFFSLEMSQEMIADRLFARLGRVDLSRIRSGRLTEMEKYSIANLKNIVSKMPYYIDPTPGLNINQIRSRARMAKLRHGIEMIGIDYLLLIEGVRRHIRDSEESELRHTLQSLKNMARELNIPVLILNQLNKKDGDPEPVSNDIKGTGANEAEPDVILMLHRPGFEQVQEYQPEVSEAILILTKGRNVGLGRTKLQFYGRRVTLADPTVTTKRYVEPEVKSEAALEVQKILGEVEEVDALPS